MDTADSMVTGNLQDSVTRPSRLRCSLVLLAALPLAVLAAREAALSWYHTRPLASVPAWAHDPAYALRTTMAPLAPGEQSAARAAAMQTAARIVLRSDPLNAIAMRQLGLAQQLAGSGTGLAELDLAEQLSRRDLAVQLALIEKEAKAGDLPATLRHYDRALMVYPASDAQLFPLLTDALDDRDIRTALVPYVGRGWFGRFAGRALALGADPLAFAALLQETGKQLDAGQAARLWPGVLDRLARSGQSNAARKLAEKLPGLGPGTLDQLGFSEATADPRLGSLGWRLGGDASVTASFDDKGRLAISIASNRSATAGERITLLEAGTYRIRQQLAYEAGTPRARLTWDVRCLASSRQPLLRAILPAATGTSEQELVVPKDCPAQVWRLSATADISQVDSAAELVSLVLERQ